MIKDNTTKYYCSRLQKYVSTRYVCNLFEQKPKKEPKRTKEYLKEYSRKANAKHFKQARKSLKEYEQDTIENNKCRCKSEIKGIKPGKTYYYRSNRKTAFNYLIFEILYNRLSYIDTLTEDEFNKHFEKK